MTRNSLITQCFWKFQGFGNCRVQGPPTASRDGITCSRPSHLSFTNGAAKEADDEFGFTEEMRDNVRDNR